MRYTPDQITAGLLIVGASIFFVGVVILWLGADFGSTLGQPPEVRLPVIAAHAAAWRTGYGLMAVGIAVTLLGFGGVHGLLRRSGAPGISSVGLLLLGMATGLAVAWVGHVVTLDVGEAQEVVRSGTVRGGYSARHRQGGLFHSGYTVFAFAGLATFGGAILRSSRLPQWLGWVAIGWGGLGLATFLVSGDAPPFLHYIVPVLIAVVLLDPETRRERGSD